MPKLIITETPGLDGEYEAEFDIGALTNRELRVIKKISGVTAGKLGEALRDGDNDLLIAYAVVFLTRAGKDPDMAETLLWDAPVGALQFDMAEEEDAVDPDDVRPPVSQTANGSGKELDAIGRLTEPAGSSGETSSGSSGRQENDQNPIGLLDSAGSA